MLAVFCVRLAAGMAACLLLLSPTSSARPAPGAQPLANPNFFRTHLLTVLGSPPVPRPSRATTAPLPSRARFCSKAAAHGGPLGGCSEDG